MDVLSDLVTLSALQQRLCRLVRVGEGEYKHLFGQCMRLRAEIVGRACIELGEKILEQRGRRVGLDMLREMARGRV
jgi:hypothetical protein